MSKTILSLVSVLFLGGCFLASEPFATPTPTEMSNLESVVHEDSTDVEAVARLAAGFVSEGRADEARRMLADAHRRVPRDPTLLVTLGIVEHELGLYDSAGDRYETYLQTHRGSFPDRIRARWDAIRDDDLRAEMRELLALDVSGSELGRREGRLDRQRIAVVPFVAPETDETLESLGMALSWMVGRDLGAAGLEVVDRAVVRNLVEVIGAETPERSQLSLAVDVGRLLGAGRVVLGDLQRAGPTGISWSATAVSLEGSGHLAVAPVAAEGGLDEVLMMEATIVELLRRSVSDELFLPGPGESVPTSPPSDPEALLAFGRGLRAMGAGAFADARIEFEAALELDADFAQARHLARRAELAGAMEEIPLLATLEEAVRVGELQRAVLGLRQSPGSAQRDAEVRVGDRDRTEISEVLGLDRPGGSVLLEVIFIPGNGGTE